MRYHGALATRATWTSFAALLLVSSTATCRVFLEIEVTKEIMWVEVVPFNAVWGRDLATLIDFCLVEHRLLTVVLDDVTVGVTEVPTLVRWLAILVDTISLSILQDDNVALIITIEVTKDVVLVEVPGIVVWRDLDSWVAVLELHERLLRHFKCLLLGWQCLVPDCRLNIEVEVLTWGSWLVLSGLLGGFKGSCLLSFGFSTESGSFSILSGLLVCCFSSLSGLFFSVLASFLFLLAL
jgi:hypothetical protein